MVDRAQAYTGINSLPLFGETRKSTTITSIVSGAGPFFLTVLLTLLP